MPPRRPRQGYFLGFGVSGNDIIGIANVAPGLAPGVRGFRPETPDTRSGATSDKKTPGARPGAFSQKRQNGSSGIAGPCDSRSSNLVWVIRRFGAYTLFAAVFVCLYDQAGVRGAETSREKGSLNETIQQTNLYCRSGCSSGGFCLGPGISCLSWPMIWGTRISAVTGARSIRRISITWPGEVFDSRNSTITPSVPRLGHRC